MLMPYSLAHQSQVSVVLTAEFLYSPRLSVVGASSGFGYALACHALENDEVVVATMRNPGSDTLISKYPNHAKKGRLVVLKLDVTNSKEVTAAFATIKERYGRIDVVFNNAGCTQAIGEVEQVPEELGRTLFDVRELCTFRGQPTLMHEPSCQINFWGAANVSKEAIKHFRENMPPGGRLLQNSSGSALQGIPGTAYYGAS